MHVKRIRAPFSRSPGADRAQIDAPWPQVAAVLADLDDEIHDLTARHRVSGLDLRRARRTARRMLRERRVELGVCESCRLVPAEQRVVFADLVVFAVCTPCAAGAVAGVAA
jgi:hypothetical protein